MRGLYYQQDRLWEITTPLGIFYMREYNDEITGYDEELHKLCEEIHYGGNAYFIVNKYAPKQGWKVEEVNRDSRR